MCLDLIFTFTDFTTYFNIYFIIVFMFIICGHQIFLTFVFACCVSLWLMKWYFSLNNFSQTLCLNRFFLNSICHTICRYIRLLSKVCVTKVTSKQILFHKYYNNVGSCSIKYISFFVNIVWVLKCTVTFDLFSNVVSQKKQALDFNSQ